MAHLARSLTAMALVVLAAGLFVLADAFLVAAYAVVTPESAGTASGLGHAGLWLQFAAGIAALGAVCAACWEQVLRSLWQGAAEIAIAAIGTLLIVIGMLLDATSGSSASSVMEATGIGIWALLALGIAAFRSIAEQAPGGTDAAGQPRYAVLWVAAAAGLTLLAVGSGFTLDITSKGTGIAVGVLEGAGALALCAVVAAARGRGYLASRPAADAQAGLALLAAAGAAIAIVAGVVFGSGLTVTGIRVGMSVAIAVQLAAMTVLALAAWTRVRELAAAAHPGDQVGRTAVHMPGQPG